MIRHPKAASAPSTHRETRRFSLGVIATMLVCAAAFLGIGAPAASAAPEAGPGWNYKSSFGVGGLALVYETPRSPIAVDSNGNVFAVDQNSTLQVFAPNGEKLTEVGGNFRNIAIDTNDDTLYAEELPFLGNTVVRRYTSDGQPTPTYSVDPGFEVPLGEGLAVDPTSGDLLVADPGGEAVRRYDAAGVLQDTIATPLINPAWIVAAPDGSFYVAPAEGPDVSHFSGSGTLLGTISGVGNLHGLAFDSNRSAVVALVSDHLKTYATTGVLGTESPSKDAAGLGLVFDPGANLLYEHDLRRVNSYEPSTVPGVSSPVVSNVEGHSAHVSAEVDPGFGPPAGSETHFEFSADGGKSWTSTPSENVSAAGVYQIDLTGLLAHFEYLVRAVASNDLATSRTEAVAFNTAKIVPDVETTVATDVIETGATLNGKINPDGLQTTWHFEYGTTTAYGSRVPASAASAGAERTARAFSREISGLQPGTTYHFRIVAESAAGFSAGADRTFTTATAGEFPVRAYEQVTPVDKEGAQVSSDVHVQTADDGSAIAVSTASSALNGTTSNMRENYVAWREAANWSDWLPAGAPRDVADGLFESTVAAFSDDFEHALVASNRVLAPGGIAGGGNLYVKDLRTGTYTFVGGSAEPDAFLKLTSPQIGASVFISAAPDFSWIIFVSQPSLLPEVGTQAVYRWSRSAGLSAVSVMSDGSTPPTQIRSALAQQTQTSVDGSVVYFGLEGTLGGPLYRRANGQTTLVSHADGSIVPANIPLPAFLDAVSSDGRYAVFHTQLPIPLTSHPVDSGGGAVYRYDSVDDTVTYVTDVQHRAGPTVYASDDAQTIYVDQSTNADTYGPLVVWRNGEERMVDPDKGTDAMAFSPNARYVGWVSTDGSANLYDYETDEVVCVSCPVDGGPHGRAHVLAGGRGLGNKVSNAVTDDGTMFFDTPDRLLAADHNDVRDVYAYHAGRLSLISPGTGDFGAEFVDASVDGSSVFFQTDQGLVGRDTDNETDIYVARVGGGFPEQNPLKSTTPCVRSDCGGSSSQPPEPNIGSDLRDHEDQGNDAPAIGRVRSLSASARKKLAKGKKVVLKLRVTRPGTVTVGGKGIVSSSIKVKRPGQVGLPVVLTRPMLNKLHKGRSMHLRLTIRFDGKPLRSISIVLRAPGSNKGGRS